MRRPLAALLAALLFSTNAVAETTESTPDLGTKPTLALQLPGLSQHFQEPMGKSRKWNETHEGLGLEWRMPWNGEGWGLKTSVGFMRDSVNSWGLYSAAVWQKRMFSSSNWTADIGGGPFLFYRALKFDGKRELFPGLLPVFSFEHKPSGFGANIILVPRFKVGDNEMPGVVFIQGTKTF